MSKRTRQEPEYFVCPHCGAQVDVRATSCRECGSDAETGWSEEADDSFDGGDFGDDDDFDYDDFVRREFPDQAGPAPERQTIVGWLIAAVVVLICWGLVVVGSW